MLRSILFFQLNEIVYYYYCIHITIWGCALCVLFFPRDSTYGGIFYYQNHICNREHCTLFALICYHITFSFADSLSHILREYTDRRVCVMEVDGKLHFTSWYVFRAHTHPHIFFSATPWLNFILWDHTTWYGFLLVSEPYYSHCFVKHKTFTQNEREKQKNIK